MQQELQEAVCALFQVSSDYVPSKVRCLLSLWAMFSASFHSVSWTFLVFSEPLDESYMASPDAIQPRVFLPSTEYPYRSHHAVVSPHSWISQWFGSNLLLSKLYLRKNVSFLLLGTLRVPLHSSPIFASEWSPGAHLPGVPTYCTLVTVWHGLGRRGGLVPFWMKLNGRIHSRSKPNVLNINENCL